MQYHITSDPIRILLVWDHLPVLVKLLRALYRMIFPKHDRVYKANIFILRPAENRYEDCDVARVYLYEEEQVAEAHLDQEKGEQYS